jgi:hypothetical protein
MKRTIIVIAAMIIAIPAFALDSETDVVYRDPLTVKLQLDKDHYYEEKYDRIPYVHNNDVYLFPGESFGINLQYEKGEIIKVTYQKDTKKTDVELKFYQKKEANGPGLMMLVLKNNTKNKLYIDAIMTVPSDKKIHKTNILPLDPGFSGYESWPHPIIQLVLRNIRLKE